MPRNTFFKFKQFTIEQEMCAMKVCTDACVFGAWADVNHASRILDIGTGTGLLSLMIAQRNNSALIDAVEIDESGYIHAKENVHKSPFAGRIQVFNTAIQNFDPPYRYDHIVSNPPFFQSDLRSPDASKNKAHHAETLSFSALLESVNRLVTPTGTLHILLPVDESVIFQEKALAHRWYPDQKLTLYHMEGKKPFRLLTRFINYKPNENQLINKNIYIYESDGRTYHSGFIELMKDYYLIF